MMSSKSPRPKNTPRSSRHGITATGATVSTTGTTVSADVPTDHPIGTSQQASDIASSSAIVQGETNSIMTSASSADELI